MTPHRIRAALRLTTETFAAELAAPGEAAPEWSAFEWTLAQAAAVLHGVTPLLAGRLRWTGPPAWQRFATGQFLHTRRRHGRIDTLLQQIDEGCTAAAIGFIALKGAALHRLGIYLPGQRPMSDIDLLVHPRDEPRAADVLHSLGYQVKGTTWKHGVFAPTGAAPKCSVAPFGEHRQAPIKIELHTAIAEHLPHHARDITELLLSKSLQPGRNDYPSNVSLLLHLLLHAAPSMMVHNLRLMHVHDIAALACRISPQDWSQLLTWSQPGARRRGAANLPRFWVLPPLQLAGRYFPGSVPEGVIEELRRGCPRALARLSRESALYELSNAQLYAAPLSGIAWSPSLAETARYLWHRLQPTSAQRVEQAMGRTEVWARGSSLQRPYAQRVIRQLLRPPPRPSTMYVVRAALANSRMAHSKLASSAPAEVNV
jgi:Uncharacterised nucleotidyltransferase